MVEQVFIATLVVENAAPATKSDAANIQTVVAARGVTNNTAAMANEKSAVLAAPNRCSIGTAKGFIMVTPAGSDSRSKPSCASSSPNRSLINGMRADQVPYNNPVAAKTSPIERAI